MYFSPIQSFHPWLTIFFLLLLISTQGYFPPIDFWRECKGGRDGKREREKYQCARDTLIGCHLHAPWPGLWAGKKPVTEYMSLIRIKLGTRWSAGLHSTHWATLARAESAFSMASCSGWSWCWVGSGPSLQMILGESGLTSVCQRPTCGGSWLLGRDALET